jgi:AcrR family transcriptional regulator
MLTAMIEVACEHGGRDVTVARVVSRAGVSRRTFYEIFDGCDDCLLTAFEDGIGRMARKVVASYEQPGRWREKLRAALTTLLCELDREPQLARFLVVETLSAGSPALKRRQEILAEATSAIDGDATKANGRRSSPLSAEAVVGAVASVIHDRLLDDDPTPLTSLVNPLMSTAVLLYHGPAAARRELQTPVAASLGPFEKELAGRPGRPQMRLTYRTVRTLEAVAVNPGSSNRKIAAEAGIADQGQVSKLLARLRKLGLVTNRGTGGTRGEPNAWTLTAAGEKIHHSIASSAQLV